MACRCFCIDGLQGAPPPTNNVLFALIMSRKSATDHQSGGRDDAQQTTAGATRSQLHDVDLASTFPATKIKAQLLRDEGVGRISSKAIQLIGACSAIFVRELAEAAASACENNDGDDERQSDGASSLRVLSSKVETKGRKRKLSLQNKSQSNPDANTIGSILTRDHIKDCIEQDTTKFDFLHGVLSDHVSAKEIPSYGAAYQKKLSREVTGSKQKKIKKANCAAGKDAGDSFGGSSNNMKDATATAADVGASSVLGSATEAAFATSGGDEEALRTVIGASLQEDDGFVGLDDGIVEDDEEYD